LGRGAMFEKKEYYQQNREKTKKGEFFFHS